jgi:uncharacterized membrane protein YfcA
MQFLFMILIGVLGGVLSGLFGIGGGVVLVPALILGFGYSQYMASGTSLVALLFPVGLLGVIQYYRADKIGPEQIRFGFLIAVGIFLGTYLGSKIAIYLPETILRKMFSVFLGLIAIKLWLISR